jgi:hypothetical protein
MLPGINEALEARDLAQASQQIDRLALALNRAAHSLETAH